MLLLEQNLSELWLSSKSLMESRVKSSKRLIFDRRYGWVVDEWKEPSEEALSGARGMFSILPLANAFVKFASQSIKLLETPKSMKLKNMYITCRWASR
ncbi:hypothetical protein ACHQM5_015324 [Ranunculus cassubicifolius]